MADVREYAGVPPVAAFADMGAPFPGGSPVVIDSTTGLCYILFGGAVTLVAPTISASGQTLLALTPAQGDVIYGSAAAVWSKLAKDTNATRYLSNTGTSNNPAWAQVALATGVSDYSISTWVPSVEDSSNSSSEGQTYSTQLGWYMKIGKLVVFWGNVVSTSLGTLNTAQNARIAGLPVASDSTASFFGGVTFVQAEGMAITAGQNVTGIVNVGTTRFFTRLWDATTGTSDLLLSEWSATGGGVFYGIYQAGS